MGFGERLREVLGREAPPAEQSDVLSTQVSFSPEGWAIVRETHRDNSVTVRQTHADGSVTVHEERMDEGLTRQRGEGPDLSRQDRRAQDLTGVNWSGANVNDANLHGADLSGANLANANLAHADLREANLQNANLAGANLASARLYGAKLAGADLTDTNLTDTVFATRLDRGDVIEVVDLDRVVSWSGARRGAKIGEEARLDVEKHVALAKDFFHRETEARLQAELGSDE
jgi:uncharacterized protein YjbI with pentapeptide repeats